MIVAPPSLWSCDSNLGAWPLACVHDQLQYPVIMSLGFAAFPVGFQQATSIGEAGFI